MTSDVGGSYKVIDKGAYFAKIDYHPHAGQLQYHNAGVRFRVPVCGRRYGKDLSISTFIATPSGWTTMGGIGAGDYVFGPDGRPTRVVAKSEVMYNKCYEVVFDDGSVLVAGEDHEWAIETYAMRKSRGNGRWTVPAYKVVTTSTLADRVTTLRHPDSVMLAQSIQTTEQKLPIDPYVFGAWLGDGNTSGPYFTAHEEDISTFRDHFEAAGYVVHTTNSKYKYRVEGLPWRIGQGPKVVPDVYYFGSAEQRLALLQGLMDTDGTISIQCLQFDNVNETLVDLVEWLVVSLGGKVRRDKHTGRYKDSATNEYKDCRICYRANFNVPFPVFRLQRKLAKQSQLQQGQQTCRRYIKEVRVVETVPTQCIQVARTDGLWLAGKSLTVTHNSVMAGRDREASLLAPKKRGWIVGPTYDLGEKEFRVMWMDMIVKLKLGRDKRVRKAYNKKQGQMYIEFPWHSLVEVRSADHAESLVGEDLDWVIMSEAAKHKKETFERYIRAALSDRRGSADFPTTPEGQNWLYDLWLMGQNPEFVDYWSQQFPSWLNPHVYPGGRNDPEIKLIQQTTLAEWFNQEIAADFTAFVGKIYPYWQVKTHVKSVEFNPDWPNFIAFDWGYVNPLAAIEFQVAPDDTVYVWREHYRPYVRLEEHCRILQARDQPPGYHLDLCFGDAADPEAAITVAEKLGVMCLALPESKQNWREGVDLVNGFLKTRSLSDETDLSEAVLPEDWRAVEEHENTVAGLYVDFSCLNTIREFNNYRAPNVLGQRIPKNPREDAQKYDDHALDAIRYGLMHIFKLGARMSSLHSIYPDLAVETEKRMEEHSLDISDIYSPEELGLYVPSGGTFFDMRSMP